MPSKIKKVIFPVAGMGTRFLPATKASPKEMLPIVDKPLIQYAAEEAVAAGITELIFITGRNKRSIEDHFDKAYELETELENRSKKQMLAQVRDILPEGVSCLFVRQAQAIGLGHAILCALPAVGNEPFAVILADDLIDAEPGVLSQMVEQYNQHGHSILGVQNIERKDTASYGIAKADEQMHISELVEKPHPDVAPSTLAVVGRYILNPRIFDKLKTIQPGVGGELQLTDAIAMLLKEEPVMACAFQGKRYDCGSKLGYLKATLSYGLKHPEVGSQFKDYLHQCLKDKHC